MRSKGFEDLKPSMPLYIPYYVLRDVNGANIAVIDKLLLVDKFVCTQSVPYPVFRTCPRLFWPSLVHFVLFDGDDSCGSIA